MTSAATTRPPIRSCCGDWPKTLPRNGYDLRQLFRRIVRSQTYQLSSAVNDTNRADQLNYSRALSRPLDSEILLDAICDVTGVPETYGNWLHRKKGRGGAPKGTRAVQLKETDIYHSNFLTPSGAQPVFHSGAGRQIQPDPGPAPAGGIDLQRQALDRGGAGL